MCLPGRGESEQSGASLDNKLQELLLAAAQQFQRMVRWLECLPIRFADISDILILQEA